MRSARDPRLAPSDAAGPGRPRPPAPTRHTPRRSHGAAGLDLVEQGFVGAQRLASGGSAGRLRVVSWRGSRISVVFPTYNERDVDSGCHPGFRRRPTSSTRSWSSTTTPRAGTSEEVAAAAARSRNETVVREVHEPRQGYGYAIRRGLREATGDYIVISEPDGTFLGRDTFKLLAYVDDFDVVYGSRTARTFIWRGANMGALAALGQLGRGQDDGVPVQQHQPDRRRLHHAPGPPRGAAHASRPSSPSAAARSGPR